MLRRGVNDIVESIYNKLLIIVSLLFSPNQFYANMMKAPYDLSGRTAIVTGSSTGNGRAIAISLAQAGVNSEYAIARLPL